MVTLEHLADYLAAKLPNTVGTWHRSELVNWLAHQWAQRALAVVVKDDSVVMGVGIAVRCEAPDMDDPWTRWNDRGNCVYVHQVAASTGEALCVLMAMLAHRIPDWESVRIYATRRERRVRLRRGTFTRRWRRMKPQRV